jgi:ribosomal protein S1
MSKKDYGSTYAELLLERKENSPKLREVCSATILAKNSRGLLLDINKTFEGYVSTQELGSKSIDSFEINNPMDVLVIGESEDGIYKLSIRQIEESKKWQELESLKGQNLELSITKVSKSGVEVEIAVTQQTGFIPFGYLDHRYGELKNAKREDWIGLKIPGRIHELDQSRNKIILDNKVISAEQKEARQEEILSALSIGQNITGTVVRTTDFGVFVDLGGIDALIPASELSWRRFKKPAEVVEIGSQITARVFRIDHEGKKIALSIKQIEPDPWTVLNESVKVGAKLNGKVVTKAEFGVFVEVLPGVEALLHKSHFDNKEEKLPAIGEAIEAEIVNLDAAKKRMGIKPVSTGKEAVSEEKELEHV